MGIELHYDFYPPVNSHSRSISSSRLADGNVGSKSTLAGQAHGGACSKFFSHPPPFSLRPWCAAPVAPQGSPTGPPSRLARRGRATQRPLLPISMRSPLASLSPACSGPPRGSPPGRRRPPPLSRARLHRGPRPRMRAPRRRSRMRAARARMRAARPSRGMRAARRLRCAPAPPLAPLLAAPSLRPSGWPRPPRPRPPHPCRPLRRARTSTS